MTLVKISIVLGTRPEKVVLQAQRYVDRVVVCDDGSRDLTAEIAEGLGADVVRHERNLGYGAAVSMLSYFLNESIYRCE